MDTILDKIQNLLHKELCNFKGYESLKGLLIISHEDMSSLKDEIGLNFVPLNNFNKLTNLEFAENLLLFGIKFKIIIKDKAELEIYLKRII